MKKMINEEKIFGYVYDHNLQIKTVQNQESKNYGKEFIQGVLNIATTEDGMNVIPVYYTYITPTTSSGKTNFTFSILKKIIDEGKTWIANGKDEAMKVKASPNLALNDFPNRQGEMVSQMRSEGGFLEFVDSLPEDEKTRAKFKVDFFITKTKKIEPDEENNVKEPCLQLGGTTFNFRGDILPITLTVRNPHGIEFFENLSISSSNPYFTNVWGNIVSTTEKVTKEEETAWGEKSVNTYEKKTKEWNITGTKPEGYAYGDDNILVEEEIIKGMQDREIMLAEKKQKQAEWEANKNTQNNTNGFMDIPQDTGDGKFKF